MTSYNLFFANFHFVRPFWLLAIIVLFIILWLLKKHHFHQSPWQKFLPPHLSGVLVEGASNSSTPNKQAWHERIFLIKPFFIGLLSIIALAGPAWQKLPQPVYQTERGSVLIMDMSYSMYATDIKPNRLTRSRFKAIDLLNKINDGDVGLIAYAGAAFVISPLTQDIRNIELLLPSLSPDIMPELGATPFAALTLAHEMLSNTGHLTGDIYWFTDDVDNEDLSDIYDWSNKYGHRLNILGIGSQNGAPIKLPSGELLKDDNGAIVVPRLPSQKLQSLAARGRGSYQTISNDDSDIESLISNFDVLENNKNQQQKSQQTGDQWQEQGAWLLLLVLPLALSYFRRGGAILVLPLTCLPLLFLLSISLVSPVSFANENTPAPSFLQKTWQDFWKTQDQQAQQQYNQENYQGAAQQFNDSQWQGSAHYKAGNYQQALDAFSQGEQADSANSLYNQGNSLAKMQKYEQAIDAYQQALKKNPDLQDAKDNMAKAKAQQKKKQEQNKNDQSEGDKSKDDASENKDKQQKQDKDSQSKSQDENDKEQDQQSSEDSTTQSQQKNEQKDEQQEASQSEGDKKANKDENESTQKQEQQAKQADEPPEKDKEKTAAQVAAEQQAKETTQKHQQLLNKVTDDPYLLLRNKMQLEYQKRQQNGASQGVQKKW